jgi:hypothetical protein
VIKGQRSNRDSAEILVCESFVLKRVSSTKKSAAATREEKEEKNNCLKISVFERTLLHYYY